MKEHIAGVCWKKDTEGKMTWQGGKEMMTWQDGQCRMLEKKEERMANGIGFNINPMPMRESSFSDRETLNAFLHRNRQKSQFL